MPFPDQLRQNTVRLAVASGAAFGVAEPAAADDYDMDCKLILCLPAGFPSGCGDAFDHMIDRLRDGKSPIGFCAMSDGSEFSDYDLDHRFIRATSASAWECPEGTTLSHSVTGDVT